MTTSPQQRLEALEAAGSRIVAGAMAASIAGASNISLDELTAEADRILAATPDYSPAARLAWMAADADVPVDQLREGAAALLAECR